MAAVPDKSNGDTLFAENLMKLLVVDTTGGQGGSTTFDLIFDLPVPAGKVDDFVMIDMFVQSRGQDTDSTASDNPTMDIRAGSAIIAGSLTNASHSKKEFITDGTTVSTSNEDTTFTWEHSRNIRFYYQPTSDEKTDGFKIGIFAKGTSVSVATCGVSGLQATVWGV